MKVKFEFDTESENFDRTELEQHIQASRMASCISKISDQIRSWYKWETRDNIPIDEIAETLREIINDEVDLERLGY